MLLKHSFGLFGLASLTTASAIFHGPTYQTHFRRNEYSNETIIHGYDPSVQYDYVVVGSGPGGGPLASRLALAGHKVLIIEAGDDQGNQNITSAPALQLQSTEFDLQKWDYFVNHYASLDRQKRDSKMVYRKPDGTYYVGLYPPGDAKPLGVLYPRAGTLGGCAAHNAMITIYPYEHDWEYIQNITGDDSWAPDHMRTYFEKLERAEYLPNSVLGHGFSGWLPTSLTSLTLVVEDFKLLSLIISAATALGKNILAELITTVTGLAQILTLDLNSPNNQGRDTTDGMYQVPLAVDGTNSRRASPRDFILQVANAVNEDGSRKYHLDVALNTFVTKVNFDTSSSTPRAIGVEFLHGQSLYAADPRYSGAIATSSGSINVTKEVILSAGTFETPKLLKLSGVGPSDELQKWGINVVKDLPGVGTNMQDRYEVATIGRAPTVFTLTKDCTFGYTSPDPCMDQWYTKPGAILKGTYGTNGIAVAVLKKSSTAGEAESWGENDLLISGAPAYFKGYYPGYSYDGLGTDFGKEHWSWITLKARSRNNAGTVTLTSLDARQKPNITFNYFDTGVTADGADEDDLQAVYESMEFSRKMFGSVIPLDGSFNVDWPAPNVTNEADLKQFIKDEAWGHHASCTCPIGSDDDKNAALDTNFKVRGVDGLRVVDASVFPKIPGYYIALPIYIISEKAADVIINGS